MKCWHTPTALGWLQTILQERFGHAFVLEPHADGRCIALYLPGDARCITLALDGATFTRADSDLPCTPWNASTEGWPTALPGDLLAPGIAQLPAPLIASTENGWYIGYDILGLAYWILTRQEEVGRTDLDSHGRFPAVNSHAYRYEYLERPIVDEWLHILGQVITRTWPSLALTQHQFSMKVSHDVDSPSLYAFKPWKTIARMMAGHLLKRRDIKAMLQAPWCKLTGGQAIARQDPHNRFDWIMNLSERHGLTSSFYFICGHTAPQDADYQPEDPRIVQLMRHIHQRGHEIGLHPSYGTYQKPELIAQEVQRLRTILADKNIQQNGIGGRMHYLRWEQPTTLQALSDAGMAYDSTLSYADRPGFRCGTCFEYPAFNPVTQQTLPLRVRPLIAMECSVIDDNYLGMGYTDDALQKFKQLKENCKKVEGCFTLLWHNSHFSNLADFDFYQQLVSD